MDQFFEIFKKDFENVNKGNHKVSKHAKMWINNAFNECKNLWSFNREKFIVNLLDNENSIKELVEIFALFICQVAKKDGSLYLVTR
jgi:hypothetical protein